MRRYSHVSEVTMYHFLSLFIEFLDIGGTDFRNVNNYVCRLKALLTRIDISYHEIESQIVDQLYWIFRRLNLIAYPDKTLKNYYLKFLSAETYDIQLESWYEVMFLIENNIFSAQDIAQIKQPLFDLIRRIDVDDGHILTKTLSKLVDKSIITASDKEAFLALLTDHNENLRVSSWAYVGFLVQTKIITILDATSRKTYFLKLLHSSDPDIMFSAWYGTHLLIHCGVLKSEEITQTKQPLFDLLNKNNVRLLRKAWLIILSLNARGLLTTGEKDLLLTKFVELVRSRELDIILYAYDLILPPGEAASDKSKAAKEDKTELGEALIAGLKDSDLRNRWVGWINTTLAIKKDLIKAENIIPMKSYFLEMLSSLKQELYDLPKMTMDDYYEMKSWNIVDDCKRRFSFGDY